MNLSQRPGEYTPACSGFHALLVKHSTVAITAYSQVPILHLGRVEQRVREDLLSSPLPWLGFEPAMLELADECLIHWAMTAL